MAYIKGIDVAHWEPNIDWARVRAQEIRFAFIKATQADFADQMFNSHWAGAKQAGILRGAYHFIDPRVDGRRQAEAFLRTVKLEEGDLPPVLDLEDLADEFGVDQPAAKRSDKKKGNKGGQAKPDQGKKGAKGINTRQVPNSDVVACVEVWLDIVERETGRKPILYSSPSYLESRMRGINNQTPQWAKDYVIWIANYLDHEVTENDLPLQPKGWPDWKFWQYSDDSFLDGIFNKESTQRTEVDMNFFRGTLDELYGLAGVAAPSIAGVTEAAQPEVAVSTMVEKPVTPVSQPVSPPPSPQTNPVTYQIQPGDSLFAIAMKFHTTVDAIMALNPQITNPNFIMAGQTLTIPPAA